MKEEQKEFTVQFVSAAAESNDNELFIEADFYQVETDNSGRAEMVRFYLGDRDDAGNAVEVAMVPFHVIAAIYV